MKIILPINIYMTRMLLLISAIYAPILHSAESKILVSYFSVPEDVALNGVDAATGASLLLKDGMLVGSNQYVAQLRTYLNRCCLS
ncbi:MAG: hypothetical protein ACRCSS_15220 [Shewanella sp.]